MNLYGVCCGPCEDEGLCCQETSCCLECHFSLEENVALKYVPEHLAAQVRKQHADLQREGFPPEKVEAYDSGELHLQPKPEAKPRAIAVGAVNPQANAVGATPQPTRTVAMYPYPRRTRSVLGLPAQPRVSVGARLLNPACGEGDGPGTCPPGVKPTLLPPRRVPNGEPEPMWDVTDNVGRVAQSARMTRGFPRPLPSSPTLSGVKPTLLPRRVVPNPDKDYQNRGTCKWWCGLHPDSQYCQPGGVCHEVLKQSSAPPRSRFVTSKQRQRVANPPFPESGDWDTENRLNCTWWCTNFPDSQYCQPGSICDGYVKPKPRPQPQGRPGSGPCVTYDANGNCIRRPQAPVRTMPRGMPRRGSRAVLRY